MKETPLRGISMLKIEPHLFVALGATGDLMQRMLLPALYKLSKEYSLRDRGLILGAAIDDLTEEAFRERSCRALTRAGLEGDFGAWCSRYLYYQPVPTGSREDFVRLAARIAELEGARGLPGNRAFYMALPPAVLPDTIRHFGESGLNRSPGWTRIVLEKPFGHDLGSARELNRLVHEYFDESQVYRIDHYLGKETVQNLLVFRFANSLFETLWNRDRVERIQILVAESLGVEHRAAYYDQAGGLRDMIQNHLTQLLTIVGMELPAAFDPEAVRYEKLKVLRAVQPIGPEDVVFGQYTRGRVEGREMPGYREEPGVRRDSEIETFVALRLEIANWRWQGVPFYLTTGKRLQQRLSQITVTFRAPPVAIFQPLAARAIHPNRLVMTIQPDEGFDLEFEVKTPGQSIVLDTQRLRFRYAETFAPLPPAYETLLLDVLVGDPTLFVSSGWVEASWALYTPLLEHRPPVRFYPAGSWGPPEAMRLLAGIPKPRGTPVLSD